MDDEVTRNFFFTVHGVGRKCVVRSVEESVRAKPNSAAQLVFLFARQRVECTEQETLANARQQVVTVVSIVMARLR